MKQSELNILVDKIKSAQTIAIAGHKNPDGDSLCSVLALARLIHLNFGKDPICIYDGNIPDMLDLMPGRRDMQYCGRVAPDTRFDLVFILDCGNVEHLGGMDAFVKSAGYVISVDHHVDGAKIGNLCLDDVDASSVGQILFEIAGQLQWSRDDIVNDLIAVSVLTDTGYFKFARIGAPLRIMADLVDAGVDIEHLSDLMNNKPRKTILTEASVVSRAEFFCHGRVALAVVDAHDYKNLDGRGELILSLLGQIKGVEYVVLLKQQKENQTGVSLRSRSHPVNEIAVQLGGGGHAYAAGAVVHDSLENVRAKILKIFKGAK